MTNLTLVPDSVDTDEIAALTGRGEINFEWLGTTSEPHHLVEAALHDILHLQGPHPMEPGALEVVIVGQPGTMEISLL
ncbi:hypothetical protein [Cupriavidus basilensis]|uniref:hypothetical protein n=1 Tax=Cupriavidus basilensis TaxID=68895 RepID=UPI0023E8C9C6|nr:hypothetical protein [Cupriavidus basilensis]MDF3886706.1 hypothetical protein [Cupriavidus basilensis]